MVLDNLELTLAIVGYLAIAFCIMRFAYPRVKPTSIMRKNDGEAAFVSALCGLFFPLIIVLGIGYYLIRGMGWLISYQNHPDE